MAKCHYFPERKRFSAALEMLEARRVEGDARVVLDKMSTPLNRRQFLGGAAGGAALLRRQPAAGVMHIEPAAGAVLLVIGLLALWLGVLFWRLARRRARRGDGLSLSPRLMKKRG